MRTCQDILIEHIHRSLYKVLVLETMVVVVFCNFCFLFCCSVLTYIILIMYMNIDFFNKFNVRKLTLMFLFTNIGAYEQ